MSTSTATAYEYNVAGHLSFGAPKCEKAQKSSGFWANRTYRLCIKDEKYDVRIDVHDSIKKDLCGAIIKPLSSNKEKRLQDQILFESLGAIQVSEFYVVSVSKDEDVLERVIMIPTIGLPDGRDADIVKSVIKDRRSFIEYISFILGDDYVQSFLENLNSTGDSAEWKDINTMPAVYEKMLKTSVLNPDKLSDIQYITRIIEEEDIIPVEFREMYQTFCETLKI